MFSELTLLWRALQATLRQHTAPHTSGFLGTERFLSSQKSQKTFLKISQVRACAHPHTKHNSLQHRINTNSTQPQRPLLVQKICCFSTASRGKTCYKSQFQIICITCSYRKFLASPRLSLKQSTHTCARVHKWDSLISIALHSTSVPWTTSWTVKRATNTQEIHWNHQIQIYHSASPCQTQLSATQASSLQHLLFHWNGTGKPRGSDRGSRRSGPICLGSILKRRKAISKQGVGLV